MIWCRSLRPDIWAVSLNAVNWFMLSWWSRLHPYDLLFHLMLNKFNPQCQNLSSSSSSLVSCFLSHVTQAPPSGVKVAGMAEVWHYLHHIIIAMSLFFIRQVVSYRDVAQGWPCAFVDSDTQILRCQEGHHGLPPTHDADCDEMCILYLNMYKHNLAYKHTSIQLSVLNACQEWESWA